MLVKRKLNFLMQNLMIVEDTINIQENKVTEYLIFHHFVICIETKFYFSCLKFVQLVVYLNQVIFWVLLAPVVTVQGVKKNQMVVTVEHACSVAYVFINSLELSSF